MTAQEQLGANIRRHRRALGLSQLELALRCGMDMSDVSKLELGKKDAQTSTIVRIARGLGIAPGRLFTGVR